VPADFTIKQGDTNPSLSDTLTYSNGAIVDLTGATVVFEVRSFSSASLLKLTGTLVVPVPASGVVVYSFSAQDTALAGYYMANWVVTFPDGGGQMTFPTVGYMWLSVEPSLVGDQQQLVSLPDVKDYLNIQAQSRERDAKLLRYIASVTPMIEAITGPILPKIYDEWHDGGSNIIELLRKPATGFGTSPVLTLIAASEYRGPIEYPLALIASPVFGSIYSLFLNSDMGTVTRRSAGGSTIAFFPGREQVHIIYQAGQSETPPNVYEATLELLRINYQTTQQVGTGRQTVSDAQDGTGPAMGFFIPRRVREQLAPTRRAPSFA